METDKWFPLKEGFMADPEIIPRLLFLNHSLSQVQRRCADTIPGVFWENFSPVTAGHMARHTYADRCSARRQSSRIVVYPRVINRQRRAARQLLFVEDNARAHWHGTTSLLKITHCHCLHYCVGDGIMPARSNSSSGHDLSAMYPGVMSVVWRGDAIPQ
jgi:hypothetical protein